MHPLSIVGLHASSGACLIWQPPPAVHWFSIVNSLMIACLIWQPRHLPNPAQIHWFSIINSLAIVLLLTGIVAMIMMRTLRRDFNRYNEQVAATQPPPNRHPTVTTGQGGR